MWLTRMGRSFKTIAFSIYAAAFGNGVAVAQASEDLVTVFDGKKYTIAYYKSSVKNLPPEWKKVWILTNRKLEENTTPERIQSIRRNVLFNCVRNTYSTLATVNYATPNAAGKPNLQTDTGFELNDDPVPEDTALAIIKSQICGT
jgi:hypothetical protein